MYENINNCPICEKTDFTNFLICKDYSVSGESFAISQCKSCGLKFTNPRPDQKNIDKFYESKDYISHTNVSNNLINLVYKIARKFTLFSKYKILKKYTDNKGRILDYGCGTGNFLSYCKEKGWDVIGVEPNSKARSAAEKENLIILNSIDNLQDEEKFDVITLWHVLEHIHDLKYVFNKLKARLNKNGIICVAVPNSNSYDCDHYKQYWAAYDLPRHLYHFNPNTFKNLVKTHRMKIIEIIPMKLDAFYVSLLSEKYKYGKNNFLKAVITGLKSNRWGEKNNNNYSSLIYIIKK